MSMFCNQCQEAVNNKGCTIQGVCGKGDNVSNLQDTLLYTAKGISLWATKARELGITDEKADRFVAQSLFTTITNVNFDEKSMASCIKEAFKVRDEIKNRFLGAYKEKTGQEFNETVHDAATWEYNGITEDLVKKGLQVSAIGESNEDIKSLKDLIIGGLKGIAAYTDHAYILDAENNDILQFIQKALAKTLDKDATIDELLGLTLETGKYSVDALALLDGANTKKYGHQELTQVSTGTKQGPAILVSGHDLLDLEEILKQTEGKGVNVYTHGEMLPANAYPEFKKYSHLAGNYGTAWYNQQNEFEAFNGAIVMTTNCIQKPKESYKDRLFTTGLVAWDGVEHIADRTSGNSKDFSKVTDKALILGGLEATEGKSITIGLAHNQVFALADKVVAAVKSGAIKRFVVMAGCDGRQKERSYFTEVAENLPKDTVILTAGCAKFRYNMLDLGDIDGIPRVIDAGQCNDSYSLAVIALKLKEIFELNDINELPISYDIAWYEQKAVCVLLALLHLGVKTIRLGPTLPAFLSPNVVNVLVEKFNIKPITTANEDIRAMMEGN